MAVVLATLLDREAVEGSLAVLDQSWDLSVVPHLSIGMVHHTAGLARQIVLHTSLA